MLLMLTTSANAKTIPTTAICLYLLCNFGITASVSTLNLIV